MMFRVLCFAFLVTLITGLELKAQLHSHWQKFKSTHQKSYTAGEEDKRKEVFKQNVEKILKHNIESDLGVQSTRLSVNEFADMTHEEFKTQMLGLKVDNVTRSSAPNVLPISSRANIPASVDWSSYDGPVKNQGSCGSCWTFATTGNLEALIAMYKGNRVTLSEQHLVDCASTPKYGNYGCDGGLPSNAMQYIKDNNGISSDTCYRYAMRQGTCQYNRNCNSGQVTGVYEVPYGDENYLMQIVGTRGPVAIGIDAGQSDFQMHGAGIYRNPSCSGTPNHAVLAVGYGTENGTPYWLVKNSWGTSWGNRGYFKLQRGVNRCGVSNLAAFPTV